jgi:hypothetical protein
LVGIGWHWLEFTGIVGIGTLGQDYQFLYDAGIVAVFVPGTVISEEGTKIL